MTLKEKFINAITLHFSYEVKIDESIKIADDYATGFADWLIDSDNKPSGQFTIKQLLEIYKKEKGL